MSTFPSADVLGNASTTEGDFQTAIELLLAGAKELPGASAESELTIAAGVITPTGASHTVDTESNAVSDDLTNLATTNHPAGRFLMVRAQDASRVVTVKHAAGGAGQVHTLDDADIVLDAVEKRMLLHRVGADWYVVALFRAGLLAAEDIGVLVQGYDADILKADVHDICTASHPDTLTTLTDAATVTPDLEVSKFFTWTLGAARNLGLVTAKGDSCALIYVDGEYAVSPHVSYNIDADGEASDPGTGQRMLFIHYDGTDFWLLIKILDEA